MRPNGMSGFAVWLTVLIAATQGMVFGAPAGGRGIEAVALKDVEITDAFWGPRIETSRKVTVPYCFKQCEDTGRISNFAKAGGLEEGRFEGIYRNDSDVYKIIEGAAYCLETKPDAELEKYVDGIIDKIGAAQWDDGYIYTYYSIPKRRPWVRFRERSLHELYCTGHFFEAACAYYQATGKKKILDIATKCADCVDKVFGPEPKHIGTPGHQEIELALVRLYRVTGEERYLKLAKFFLDSRGKGYDKVEEPTYAQDHKPVIEQDEAVGHSVRGQYMYCAMTDIAALTGDKAYEAAIDKIWENVVYKKMYLTGGVGSTHKGEAFGGDYELPNGSCHTETCAAVASAMWNQRLFLLHGDGKYIDVLERVMYNGLISGVSLKGDTFFYCNPLAAGPGYERNPWFDTPCCPTNIARFMPSVGGYVYAKGADGVYVNLFVEGSGKFEVGGQKVVLRQKTKYPWDGDVRITVEPEGEKEFAVYVRVPGWARGEPVPGDLYRYKDEAGAKPALKVNGDEAELKVEKGYVKLVRKWKTGDTIELGLPMPIRRVLCNEKVEENRGQAAIERGPLVYCFDGADNGGNAWNISLSDDAELSEEYRGELMGGVTVIKVRAAAKEGEEKAQVFTAVPYCDWGQRGYQGVAVWAPRK